MIPEYIERGKFSDFQLQNNPMLEIANLEVELDRFIFKWLLLALFFLIVGVLL